MGLTSLATYLLGALGYAALASIGICAGLRICGLRLDARRVALILTTAFVVCLAISPFPDPAALDCSAGGVPVQLVPFGFLDAPARLWRSGAPLGAWLTDLTVTSTIMNVVFFAVVGTALGTLIRRLRWAALYGLALTSGIELTQFTGLYGIYPCRYRTVDVDDVMTNILGVVLGALLGMWLRRRQASPAPS